MVYISYEELEELADELSQDKVRLRACLRAVSKKIKTIPDIWESDMSHEYIKQYREKTNAVKDYLRFLDDMIVNMNAISKSCKNLYEITETKDDQKKDKK